MISKISLITIVVCMITTLTSGLPASEKLLSDQNDLMSSIYSDCLKKDSVQCLKYKVFSYIDRVLNQKDDINLSEGITVVKTTSIEEGAPRSIESSDVDALIFDRLGRFLKTHTVKIDLKGSEILGVIESAGRSFDEDETVESRGKKKKAQKLIGPLMMGLALKAATLVPLALGTIAAIAGKALLVGKIALVISTIIGLKKLLGGQKHVTYEVVSHPHASSSSSHSISHEDSHGGYSSSIGSSSSPGGGPGGDFGGYGSGPGPSSHSSGWARSNPAEVAYAAQKPKQL